MTDKSTLRSDEGVWERLRRRKVVQWGIAYVAVAWGFLHAVCGLGVSSDLDPSEHVQKLRSTEIANLLAAPTREYIPLKAPKYSFPAHVGPVDFSRADRTHTEPGA